MGRNSVNNLLYPGFGNNIRTHFESGDQSHGGMQKGVGFHSDP